jgi:bile acid:Na+ symporter, BASS family
MKEVLAEVIKTGLPLSLMAIMLSQGLGLTPGRQLAFWKERPLLMVRSLVVILVLVPIAALAILRLLEPSPAIVIGLAILAASPAGPFQLLNIYKKGGSLVYLGTLHQTLALLAIVTVPAVLYLLSQALSFQAEVGVLQVAKTVGQTILLPVLVGIAIGFFFPQAAEKIGPPLGKVAEIVFYILAIPILVKTFGLLLKMDIRSYFVMAVFIVVNLALGHLLGPRDAQERTTLAMESGARNFRLAMAIGVLNFSQEQALPVFIPYIILFVAISTIYLKWRQRQAAAPAVGWP